MEVWKICDLGHVHWGNAGAAGFLFRHTPEREEASFLLQQRSSEVDYPGTWGIPGGAIREGESPESAAKREFQEEIGALPSYRIREIDVQDCGGNWKFHMILADVEAPFLAYRRQETDATGWFTRSDMNNLLLHPGFKIWLTKQHAAI